MRQQIAPHHKLYAAILGTGLILFLALGCVIGWFVVQNERAALQVQSSVTHLIDGTPKTITDALHVEGDATRKMIGDQLTSALGRVDKRVGESLQIISDTRDVLLDKDSGLLAIVDRGQKSMDTALNGPVGVTSSLKVAASATNRVANAYAVLPAQIGIQVSPTWTALSEEITCRRVEPDGTTAGYGGCARSAVVGALNEVKNTGAQIQIASKQFPVFVNSFTGMTGHFNHVADHYDRVLTGPTSLMGKATDWLRLGVLGAQGYFAVK